MSMGVERGVIQSASFAGRHFFGLCLTGHAYGVPGYLGIVVLPDDIGGVTGGSDVGRTTSGGIEVGLWLCFN